MQRPPATMTRLCLLAATLCLLIAGSGGISKTDGTGALTVEDDPDRFHSDDDDSDQDYRDALSRFNADQLALSNSHQSLPEYAHSYDGGDATEERLRYDIFVQYDKNSLPGKSTTVDFKVTIKHFEMMEKTHSLAVDAWMVNEWTDSRLAWDPKMHGGIKKITVPHNHIWKPDLYVYNSVQPRETTQYGSILAIVYHSGKVIFIPPVRLDFTCVMDLTYWPHDKHNCTAFFGSWAHDGLAIGLQIKDNIPKIDVPMLKTDDGLNLTRGSWKLLDSKITREVKTYGEEYVTIRMNMLVEREAPAYAWIVKGPVIGLSILTLVLFVLPPAAGEKMTFGVLCLLLNVVFIAYASNLIAITPNHLPMIVKLMCNQAMLVIASLVVGALSLRLARDPHTSGLPPYVKRPIITLSSCICLHSYKNLVSRVQQQPYGRTLKSDEFELRENGTSNGHVYSGEISASPALDWLLLAAVIDRVCLIVYLAIFIFNIVAYQSVL